MDNFTSLLSDPMDEFLQGVRRKKKPGRSNSNISFRGLSNNESEPDPIRDRVEMETAVADKLHTDNTAVADGLKRLAELEAEKQQLTQKSTPTSGGSYFHYNNPFSLDTRGASKAISQAVTGYRNRGKEKRLGEIAPELYELRRDQEQTQSRNEFLRDRVPGAIDDEIQHQRMLEQQRMEQEQDTPATQDMTPVDPAPEKENLEQEMETVSNDSLSTDEELERKKIRARRLQDGLRNSRDFRLEIQDMKNTGYPPHK